MVESIKFQRLKIKIFSISLLFLFFISTKVYGENYLYDNGKFINYIDGYSLNMPSGYKFSTDENFYRSEFNSPSNNIKIFLEDNFLDHDNYISYSVSGILNTTENVVEYNGLLQGDSSIYEVKFKRNKLKYVENDKNNYVILFKRLSKSKTLTLIAKSKYKIKDEDYIKIINSYSEVKKVPKKFNQIKNPHYKIDKILDDNLNYDTKKLYYEDFLRNPSLIWGAYFNEFWKNADIYNVENAINTKLKYTIVYQDLKFSNEDLRQALATAKNQKKVVEITFQTNIRNGINEIYGLLNGDYDDYLREMARVIKNSNIPSLMRIGNEMNGDWCSYSCYNTGLDTDIYKAFYNHVYEIFEKEGANSNLLYVFNPNGRNFPNFKYNDESQYRPDNYKYHIVGMTLYNTGTYYNGEEWESFRDLYYNLYKEVCSKYEKPIMITEFASSTIGGDKVNWVRNMIEEINKYKRIKVAIWFSGIDMDGEIPARIYKIDEPREVLDVFRWTVGNKNRDSK